MNLLFSLMDQVKKSNREVCQSITSILTLKVTNSYICMCTMLTVPSNKTPLTLVFTLVTTVKIDHLCFQDHSSLDPNATPASGQVTPKPTTKTSKCPSTRSSPSV